MGASVAFGQNVPEGLKAAGIEIVKEGEWNGLKRYDFALPGSRAKSIIVAPKTVAEGKPWIWRARFFGHQPALDLMLLEKGYHLCCCDVGGLFGAPAAVERWVEFHGLVTEHLKFSQKPVLEGMSRGGLIIFNFASAHPDKVSAIYGDNPVCNFVSWPGGRNGKLSSADWERCLKAYGITAAQADDFRQPKDEETLRPIAAAKIPVALVVGTADSVVPPKENAEPLAANYEKLGGKVKVWRKPGLNHHPHGLHPPDELAAFLVEAVEEAAK